MIHYSSKLCHDVRMFTERLQGLGAIDAKVKTGMVTRGDGHYGFIVTLHGVEHWISVEPVKSETKVHAFMRRIIPNSAEDKYTKVELIDMLTDSRAASLYDRYNKGKITEDEMNILVDQYESWLNDLPYADVLGEYNEKEVI